MPESIPHLTQLRIIWTSISAKVYRCSVPIDASHSKTAVKRSCKCLTSTNVTVLWARQVRTQPRTASSLPTHAAPSSSPPFTSATRSRFLNSPTAFPAVPVAAAAAEGAGAEACAAAQKRCRRTEAAASSAVRGSGNESAASGEVLGTWSRRGAWRRSRAATAAAIAAARRRRRRGRRGCKLSPVAAVGLSASSA